MTNVLFVCFRFADEFSEASTLLEQYRRVKTDLLNFRNML